MTSLPPLPAPILTALADKGFDTLTPVQEAVLEPGMAGRDLLVSAQTGSGKTLAFGLALAADLLQDAEALPPPSTPQALVFAPTRELALQVGRELAWLYAPAGAVIAHCVGGMDPRAERRVLERGAHLVVGTPGRLRDHLERGALDPATLSMLVLDEADEMLDLGFREDLEFLLGQLPTPRRTLMFSATMGTEIERLARTYMTEPARIATGNRREAHADIAYQALVVAPADHETAIVNVLRYHEARNAIVFCKTRAAVNHLTARFHNRGFAVVPLSGELAQEERARALQSLRDGRARVCVATDVAARGIDLPGLDLVIHADLPGSTETLLHRSGRTGRAGRKGVSVLIVPVSAKKKIQRILAQAGVVAEWGAAPTAAEVIGRDTERLLTDEVLTAPETPDEGALITLLAERFTARELAAGVARQYLAARSAPEDVAAVNPSAPEGADRAPAPRRERTSFNGPWLRLSVGAEDGAEARWLLPLLCRAGDITRDDIGAIRVQDDHTLVQLSAEGGAQLMDAVRDTMMLNDEITLAEIDAPDLTALRPPRAGGKPAGKFGGKPGGKPHRKGGEGRPQDARSRDSRAQNARPDAESRAPRMRDETGGRAERKPTGPAAKPAAAKPAGPRPDAQPPRPRIDPAAAMNPSARLAPPKGKGTKPGGKPFTKSGPRPPGAKPFGKAGGKAGGKPGGKPFAGGSGKSYVRPARGGDAPPRRPPGPRGPRG